MIITNIGKQGVDSSEHCEVSKVVFSDLRLSGVIKPEGLTGVKGTNTKQQDVTIGLLSSGYFIIQATADANFTVRSAFIFAQGNGQEFLLAVTKTKDGEVNEEISFDKLRKLSFNALSSELVLKSDVSSMVASAVARLDGNGANTPGVSIDTASLDSQLASKANTSDLANYAKASELSNYATNEAVGKLSSTMDSKLASKANTADLSNYVRASNFSSELSNKASTTKLSSYADSFNQQLSSKADITALNDYVKTDDLGNQIDTKLNSAVSNVNLSGYAKTESLSDFYKATSANDSFGSVNSVLQKTAKKTDLDNYAKKDVLTPQNSEVGKVDPSTIFRGYITDDEYTLKDVNRPDGIYKVTTWIKQPKCEDLPSEFYGSLGYVIQKTTIDEHYGIIHVVGTKNQFSISWIGWGTSWADWVVSNVT